MNLKNKNTKLFLEIITGKNYNKISNADLNNLENMSIDSKGLTIEETEQDFLELLKECPDIKYLNLINTVITTNMSNAIAMCKINKIYLKKCTYEDENNILFPELLSEIILRECFFDNYNLLLTKLPDNIISIEINTPINKPSINIEQLKKYSLLKNLTLNNCNINWQKKDILKSCEKISLLNTEINEKIIEIIELQPSLKKLYISKEFYTLERIDKLKEKIELKNSYLDDLLNNMR